GVLAIDSEIDTGYHIYAVHIPRKACKNCQELGYEWFQSCDFRKFNRVFLQDRTKDQYLVRKA
ncbi:MAG: histone deacetylase, partial [Acidobacteriota bacterium]